MLQVNGISLLKHLFQINEDIPLDVSSNDAVFLRTFPLGTANLLQNPFVIVDSCIKFLLFRTDSNLMLFF